MSRKEIRYAEVIPKVLSKEITQKRAAELVKVSVRQVQRLCRQYKAKGIAGLVHKNRSRPSNRIVPKEVSESILELIRSNYRDFKPQLIHEILFECHGIKKSPEWIRQLLIKNGLWQAKKRKNTPVHQRRSRRSRFGELVQSDGSYHAWFEDRGPKCCLMIAIDDAMSMITSMNFVNHETTEGYMDLFKIHIERYGKPLAIYTDKLNAVKGTGSQVKRALDELGIELINANSPQAKGRVERAFSTLQDRLIKLMRLENISSIEEGNKFLEDYRLKHNKQFARKPLDANDAHIPLSNDVNLGKILVKKDFRVISKSHSISYNHKEYILQNGGGLRGKKASVYEINGQVHIEIENKEYEYKIYGEQPYIETAKSKKEVDAYLDKKTYMSAIQRHRKGIRIPR